MQQKKIYLIKCIPLDNVGTWRRDHKSARALDVLDSAWQYYGVETDLYIKVNHFREKEMG